MNNEEVLAVQQVSHHVLSVTLHLIECPKILKIDFIGNFCHKMTGLGISSKAPELYLDFDNGR